MLTLDDQEEAFLKRVLAYHSRVRGSLEFELQHRLFESPRSDCHGARLVSIKGDKACSVCLHEVK
jgi:hypothetical protein